MHGIAPQNEHMSKASAEGGSSVLTGCRSSRDIKNIYILVTPLAHRRQLVAAFRQRPTGLLPNLGSRSHCEAPPNRWAPRSKKCANMNEGKRRPDGSNRHKQAGYRTHGLIAGDARRGTQRRSYQPRLADPLRQPSGLGVEHAVTPVRAIVAAWTNVAHRERSKQDILQVSFLYHKRLSQLVGRGP